MAVGFSAATSAALCASAHAPPAWVVAERRLPLLVDAGPLGPVWAALAVAIGVGDLHQRLGLLAFAFIIATAVAATWAGYQLFRGRARLLAAVVAGPITTAALLHWLHAAGVGEAFAALPAALAATIAVAAVLRPLVHLGRVTTVARTRALATAGIATVVHPPSGLPLLALLAAVSLFRAPRDRWIRPIWGYVLAALPASMAAIVLTVAGATTAWPDPRSIGLGLPPLDTLSQHIPSAALYPAIALVLLLVVPLRWRGGPSVLMLGVAALVVHIDGRPLAPIPVLLVFASVATAGWVWLAGTIFRRRPRLDMVLAVAAAVVAVVLASPQSPRDVGDGWRTPVATRRPDLPIVRVVEKGLVAPGETLLLHDPWLRGALTDRRASEGWRPDVQIENAHNLDRAQLLAVTVASLEQGRRVLSDSFDAAGRWSPQWVVDSGPLFWFVGSVDDEEREFTDLSRYEPPPSATMERSRFIRLSIERARFRRALSDPDAALAALPLPATRHRGLQIRLQLARSVRPHAGTGSELPAAVGHGHWTDAAVVAEAGDLMYAQGEHARATELLVESGTAGYAPAWGALVRWQLRAGEVTAAHETLDAMATDPALRDEILGVVQWLLARDRIVDARNVLDRLPRASDEAALDELTTRLLTLGVQARPPTSDSEAPEQNDTLSRR